MFRRFVVALTILSLAAIPATAALKDGATAPDFTLQASQGGKVFSFALADALKKGPVVLYFYPAAFTPGCTVEAHDFADAIANYHAFGATVIGVSHDPIEKLQRFSVSECRSKFAVAADPDQAVEKSYDAVLEKAPAYANRTSYVIAPNGTILFSYTNLNPDKHVKYTLEALQEWKDKKPKP